MPAVIIIILLLTRIIIIIIIIIVFVLSILLYTDKTETRDLSTAFWSVR